VGDDAFSFEIDGQQVRRFAEAAWDDDPRYRPGDSRCDGSVPPTFLGAASTLVGRKHSVPAMGFDVRRAFHGTEVINMHAEVTVGCRLEVHEMFRQLPAVTGARGGTMRRAARRCRFMDDTGRMVADTERVILETETALAVAGPSVGAVDVFDDGLEVRPDPISAAPVRQDRSHADGVPPSATFGSVTRTDFVRYALASGDMTAIHFDEHAARAAGYPAPFAMGMFSAALMGHALTAWVAPRAPWTLSLRFSDLVWPGDTLDVSASVGAEGGPQGRTVTLGCMVAERVVTTGVFHGELARHRDDPQGLGHVVAR
jgi:acyl dehydratase